MLSQQILVLREVREPEVQQHRQLLAEVLVALSSSQRQVLLRGGLGFGFLGLLQLGVERLFSHHHDLIHDLFHDFVQRLALGEVTVLLRDHLKHGLDQEVNLLFDGLNGFDECHGFDGRDELNGFDIDSFDGLGDADVSPDLVAEADGVASLHAEEGGVAAGCSGSSQLDFPGVVGLGLDHLGKRHVDGAHLVAGSLQEDDVHGPGSLAGVAEGPLLLENGAGQHLVLVADALLHEAAHVAGCFLLGLLGFLSLLHLLLQRLANHLIKRLGGGGVLTDQLSGRLVGLANLEQRVFSVNAERLTGLAEVKVGADGAHVAHASNRRGLTDVALESRMLLRLLQSVAGLFVLRVKGAELSGAVVSDLFAHQLGNRAEALCREDASGIAFAAGQTLLVDLGALAFEALDGLAGQFVRVRVGHNELATGLSLRYCDLEGLVALAGRFNGDAVAASFLGGDSTLTVGHCGVQLGVGVMVCELDFGGQHGGVDSRHELSNSAHVYCRDGVAAASHLFDDWTVNRQSCGGNILDRLGEVFEIRN